MRYYQWKLTLIKISLFTVAFLGCQLSFADSYESFDHISDITKDFIVKNISVDPEDKIEVHINKTNFPSQLTTCSNPITIEFPMNSTKEQAKSLELSCNAPQSWHALIPVEVQIYTKVIVAKQTILPKDVISEEDLDYTQYDKNRLYTSYYKNKEEVIGKIANRVIAAGTVLTKKNLQLPLIVQRNQIIKIIARSHAVVVEMNGIAKSDGSENSLIKVYNPSSKKTLEAIVIGPNRAEIVS